MKRADRSILTNWWFQIDLKILGLIIAFCMVGLLASISSVNLIHKVILFYVMSAGIFLVVPMVNKKSLIIAGSVVLLVFSLFLFIYTYVDPVVIRGSRRWAFLLGQSVMPADLLKPAFVVLTAWFLTKAKSMAKGDFLLDKNLWKNGMWPAYQGLFLLVLLAMFFHPDLGNMFIYLILFSTMLFWAGAKLWYMLAGSGAVLSLSVVASLIHPHFRTRLLGIGDDFQVQASLNAIRNGGLWGRWEESFLFQEVPMAATDFIFSGIAEMWGGIFAAALIIAMMVFFIILWRRAVESRDFFTSLVIIGAATVFAMHVCMNILTAVGLFMKGTTLPFISYGGSSLLSFSLLFAIVLALIRQEKWNRL